MHTLFFVGKKETIARAELVQLNALNITVKKNVDGYFNVEKFKHILGFSTQFFFCLFLYFFFIPIMLTYIYQFQL